jgi:hypothetical protein
MKAAGINWDIKTSWLTDEPSVVVKLWIELLEGSEVLELQVVGRHFVLIVTEPANLVLEPGDLFAQFSQQRFELFTSWFRQ